MIKNVERHGSRSSAGKDHVEKGCVERSCVHEQKEHGNKKQWPEDGGFCGTEEQVQRRKGEQQRNAGNQHVSLAEPLVDAVADDPAEDCAPETGDDCKDTEDPGGLRKFDSANAVEESRSPESQTADGERVRRHPQVDAQKGRRSQQFETDTKWRSHFALFRDAFGSASVGSRISNARSATAIRVLLQERKPTASQNAFPRNLQR